MDPDESERLRDAVKKGMENGKKPEELKQILKSHGYSEDDISGVMSTILQGPDTSQEDNLAEELSKKYEGELIPQTDESEDTISENETAAQDQNMTISENETVPEAPEDTISENETVSSGDSGSNKTMLFALIAAVVLIGAAGAYYFMVYMPSQESPPETGQQSQATETGAEQPDTETLLSKTAEASRKLDSASYELQGQLDLSMSSAGMQGASGAFSFTLPLEMVAKADLKNEKTYSKMADINLFSMGPSSGSGPTYTETYVVDGIQYTKSMGQWTKKELGDGSAPSDQFSSLLGEEAVGYYKKLGMEVSGSESVGGKDCYVLEISPEPSEMVDILMNLQEMQGNVTMTREELEAQADSVKELEIKYLVSKDDFLIMKFYLDAEADLDMGAMMSGLSADQSGSAMQPSSSTLGLSAELTVEFDYSQVSIELPEEAKDASEAGSLLLVPSEDVDMPD